ncbi:MAG: hypothetical protein KAX49_18535, partial [Halanaerobiales bacterium]|nr:hypothetical protein [Halanaerobiales bacterium]
MYSDGIVVDASGPGALVLNLVDYVSKDFLLKWTANDPHSGIKSYQYGVGTTRGGIDVTNGWQSLDLSSLSENESTQQINRYLSLNLTHGESYYLSVKAENGVGLWSSPAMSRALIADLEPPTILNVTAPDYTNDDSEILDVSFSSSDSHSGIIAYRYQVVDNTDLTGDLSTPINNLDAVIHDYNNTNLDITGLALDEDTVYYIAIQTRDVAGNWSDIGYSNPITVDITVPTLTFNDQSDEIVTNDGTKKVYFTTNELGTLFYRVVWLNADGTVAYAPDFESKEIAAGTDYLDFDQPECGEYKYEIYQEDLAENPIGVKTKKVRHNFPPVVTLTVSNMTTYQGHTLIFAATAFDPDGTVDKYYWYLDSNLIFEIETSTTILDHTFADIGKYKFEVVVEDNDGQKSAILDEDNPDSILTVTITNTLSGELLVDEVWSQENLPIWTDENVMKLTGTVIVPDGITLEIDPGTVISLQANASLQVYGSIKL